VIAGPPSRSHYQTHDGQRRQRVDLCGTQPRHPEGVRGELFAGDVLLSGVPVFDHRIFDAPSENLLRPSPAPSLQYCRYYSPTTLVFLFRLCLT